MEYKGSLEKGSPRLEKKQYDETESSRPIKSEKKIDKTLKATSVQKKRNSRRKHRNSHLGCGTCKKRRIKCDETLPSCLSCLKGKLHCAYLNLDGPAREALRIAQYNQTLRHDELQQQPNHRSKRSGSVVSTNSHDVYHSSSSTKVADQTPLGLEYSISRTVDSVTPKESMFQSPSGGVTISSQNDQTGFAIPYPIVQNPIHFHHQPPQVISSPFVPIVQVQPFTPVHPYAVTGNQQTMPIMYAQPTQLQHTGINGPLHVHQVHNAPIQRHADFKPDDISMYNGSVYPSSAYSAIHATSSKKMSSFSPSASSFSSSAMSANPSSSRPVSNSASLRPNTYNNEITIVPGIERPKTSFDSLVTLKKDNGPSRRDTKHIAQDVSANRSDKVSRDKVPKISKLLS